MVYGRAGSPVGEVFSPDAEEREDGAHDNTLLKVPF